MIESQSSRHTPCAVRFGRRLSRGVCPQFFLLTLVLVSPMAIAQQGTTGVSPVPGATGVSPVLSSAGNVSSQAKVPPNRTGGTPVAPYARPTLPQLAQSKPGRTLEQQLLEDMEANPLDADVQRELQDPPDKPDPKERPSGDDDAAQRQRMEELSRQLQRELGAAGVSEEENPMLDIVRRMQQVQGLIDEAKTDSSTQQLQSTILANLDELLKEARKKSQQCSGGKSSAKSTASRSSPSQASKPKSGSPSKPGTKPAKSTGTASGKPARPGPDRDQLSEVIKNIWGALPDRPSEEMLELPSEEFLPKYEMLIEAYYKRLAEEQGRGR